jgi:hypothetical protein
MLFSPLRRRTQRAVDRRFNRARYDADAIVGAFTGRLRDAIDLESVQNELVDAVGQTVKPASVAIWIAERSSSRSGPVRDEPGAG